MMDLEKFIRKAVAFSLLTLPVFAFAQFNKGQVYLGGSLSLGVNTQNYNATPNQSTTQTKNNSFSITPSFGYFVNQKVAIGGSIGYSNDFYESTFSPVGFQSSKTNSFTSNLFSRYYLPISKSFYFAVQGQIYFSRSSSSSMVQINGVQSLYPKSDRYSIGLTVSPIFIFFPAPKWAIEGSIGSLGYSYSRGLPNAPGNWFGLSAGTFSFGLAYFFKRKAE